MEPVSPLPHDPYAGVLHAYHGTTSIPGSLDMKTCGKSLYTKHLVRHDFRQDLERRKSTEAEPGGRLCRNPARVAILKSLESR